jgi:hypothetical protein
MSLSCVCFRHSIQCNEHMVHSTQVTVVSCVGDSPQLGQSPKDSSPFVFISDQYKVPIGTRIVTIMIVCTFNSVKVFITNSMVLTMAARALVPNMNTINMSKSLTQ